MDLRERLSKEIILERWFLVHYQPFDYVGVHFRCTRCHRYGHVVAKCALKVTKKVWVNKCEEVTPHKKGDKGHIHKGEGGSKEELVRNLVWEKGAMEK
jgi:hypothetical protein